MKIKSIKVIASVLIILLLCFVNLTNVNAATVTLNVPTTVTEGDTITAKIAGKAEQWNLTLKANGTTIATSNNLTNEGSEITISASGIYKTTTKGTVVFTLTGDYSYTSGNTVKTDDVNITKTVTVNAKTATNPGGQTGGNSGGSTGGNNGGTTNKPTVTEPKFTSASKTVYAKSDVNLRSSWSTSSSAVKVQKGTELRLTGTSTEKVNGYIWYRVTYNGQIKYVVRDYITETKPEEKSNNANLKSLSIEGVELTPTFSQDVTEYSAKISNYTEKEIKVIAQVAHEKAVATVEGNTNIIIGENVITAKVVAEDGTTKIYTITLTNEEKISLGLQSLKIKDVELKNFTPDKFEYEINFSQDLEKLEIEAIANVEGATVEILGNENLIVGENLITIIVKSADETETVTYQIKANKLEIIDQQQNKEINVKTLLICGTIALVVLAIIIVLIVKYVKNGETSNVDYVYNDNLENEQEEKDNKAEEKKENQEGTKEDKNEETQSKKTKVDELFENYEDEKPKRRGKGKHSN